MAMTIPEKIEFFQERIQGSRRGMDAARSTGNYQLAALNCRQAFKCRLMKGLLEWRMGTDPSDSMSKAVEGLADDWLTVSTIGGDEAKITNVPADLACFIAYLINKPCPIEVSSEGYESDRLLDVVLGDWLFDSWNGESWEQGMEQLRQAGSHLAVQTYELYKAVAHAAETDLPGLSQEGEKLFAKRKSDSFFSGGDQTEGGGEDNNVTVDYRLAALLKRAGFDGTSEVHAWKW